MTNHATWVVWHQNVNYYFYSSKNMTCACVVSFSPCQISVVKNGLFTPHIPSPPAGMVQTWQCLSALSLCLTCRVLGLGCCVPRVESTQICLFIHGFNFHHDDTFSALLAICVGNSPVPSEFPAQRSVTRCLDVFFDLHPNKWLSKQWWGWWFETPSHPLWRHRNAP